MTVNHDKTELDRAAIDRRARTLRAQAMADAFGAIARALAGWMKRLIGEPIRRNVERHRQLEELLAMDDHMLRDLGLARGNIVYAFEHGRDNDVPRPANTNTPDSRAA